MAYESGRQRPGRDSLAEIAKNTRRLYEITKNNGGGMLPAGAATESKQDDQITELQSIEAAVSQLTPAVRTHNTISSSGVGSVPVGSLGGSVLNVGPGAGTWNGVSIPAGITIPWGMAGNRDTYNAINFDATGTLFIIEYTT
jgi:hypothetical protein